MKVFKINDDLRNFQLSLKGSTKILKNQPRSFDRGKKLIIKCNIYQECCDDSLKDRISKTAVHNNFVISNTSLEIEGHCLDCNPK